MASFIRTIHTDVWEHMFPLNSLGKVFYMFLLTCTATSETSVFYFPVRYPAMYLNLENKEAELLIRDFESKGLVSYDWGTEEILVRYYFENHSPIGGITYEMYAKDLAKVRSSVLLNELKEHSQNFKVSVAFYAALADVFPELEDETIMKQYRINWSKNITTLAAARAAAAKGRAAAAST